MTTTPTTHRGPAATDTSGDDRHHGRLLAVLTLCLALLTVTAVLSWARMQAEPPRPTNSVYGPGSPELPGGSVYNEQVPQSPTTINPYAPGNPLASGGSVYNEQVPQAH
jgi:hypothetical protein